MQKHLRLLAKTATFSMYKIVFENIFKIKYDGNILLNMNLTISQNYCIIVLI